MGSDWTEATLGNLCDFLAGSAFPKKYQGEAKGDYPFIKVSDMNLSGNERHIIDANNWVSESTRAKIGAKLHPKGSIAFAKIGVALTYNRRRILTQPTILDNNMMSVIPNTDVVNSIYFYYLLTTIDFNDVVCGTSLPYLRAGDLKKFQLQLPPLPEQRAIAHILGSLDDKIELNHRMNRTLEAMARAIFKSWFVDFDPVRAKAEGRPTGLPDDIAALFPDSFEDSELGEIPKGWEVVTFEELTEAKQGKYIPKNDMSDIQTNEHIYPVWGGNGIRGYSSTYMYEEPVVVLTCRGSNCGRIDLTESPAWISNIAFACSPKYGSINFINVYFHFSSFSETITGSAQPQITYTSLKNKRMQFPVHKEICDAYSKKIDSLYMMIRENNRQSTTLATLRDTLLPKLISGELRVPDAEKFVEEAGV